MADDSKNRKEIPSWQKAANTNDVNSSSSGAAAADETSVTPQSHEPTPTPDEPLEITEEVLEVARDFLRDETVKNSPREDKVEFLQSKGLSAAVIDKLLIEDDTTSNSDFKTVHDSTKVDESIGAEDKSQPGSLESQKVLAISSKRPREVAPVITYPEFLLKPQKPPPLITVSRLVNAAYALAGVSVLTWGASKYLVEPMLETLTEARHSFADTTKEDLEKMNEKLETMVSHVPYIASSAVKKVQDIEEDAESVDSDPTEFFHRDIATQTTPGLSRSSSVSSNSRTTLDPTISQAQRLSGLAYSLRDLVRDIDDSTKHEQKLKATVEDFQKKIDHMDSSYGVLRNDYYSSTSIYATANNEAKKNAPRENEAQKFKQEIRALKGAFLSSRNFPAAPRTTNATANAR